MGNLIRLTPREYDVLIRFAKKSEDIAQELEISLPRVKGVYTQLAGKFDVCTRTAIVIKALKLGLVDLDSFIL